MIRKRLLSACLALALCLGLLPVTAEAAAEGAPSQLYVGNYLITNSGTTTYLKAGSTQGSLEEGSETDWTVKYDPSTATLTLSGATIKGGSDVASIPYGAGIYAQGSNGQSVALTIKLIGENTITGYFGIFLNAEISASSYGTNATLTITGENNGSLGVSGSNHGIFVKSGTGNASLNIEKATVTSSTNDNYAAGVYVMSSMHATSSPQLSLKVNGGSLTASGGDGISFNVGSSGDIGATTSLTISDNAIVKAINGIEGYRVDKPTPSGTGIVFDDKEGTVYGAVTLQEDLEIGEGESLTIPSGSSLNANGKLTNDGTINVESGGNLEGEPTSGSGTVVKAPTITTPPTNQSVTVGQTASFTVEANGDSLSYQWQQSADNGTNWNNISGATSNSYTTDAATLEMNNYQYQCVVSNSAGSVTSSAATLTVNAATVPVTGVSLTPASLSLFTGDTATLTATVQPSNATNQNVTWSSDKPEVATVDANGKVTAVGEGNTTITATTVDGGKTATCTVTVKPTEYTVTVLTDGSGSASASPATAEAGTTVTLTADPDNGWRFSRWEVVEGDVTISGNSFTMPAENVTVRAVFSPVVSIPDTYDIDLIAGEGGKAKLSLTNASEGSTITVTATPDEGYELDYITVDGERIDGTTFTMPDHDVTVRVYFTDGSATLPFTDVSAGAWYYDAVSYVYANGLMDGVSDTLFDPDGTMTRAMVWAILARVDGETVTGEDWIETAREWAVAEGVSDGENANGYVTREQLATMLWRYASGKGYDVSIGEDTNILSYADFADLSEYAIPAMQWACGAGVITGVTDATLVPQGEATRAQVAAMLMRFCEAIG